MKKRKKDKEKRKVSEKICDCLEISSDILSDIPRFTINDNREVQIENYKSVIEYTQENVRLGAKKYEINISGEELTIVCITDEQIYIKGKIAKIDYIF
ncbi:MAG: YabP/YqfC family sporulation protein [Clostridia bacterium]|nr:YabP/YqfC family sporulation protein [Clostridia bacterium]